MKIDEIIKKQNVQKITIDKSINSIKIKNSGTYLFIYNLKEQGIQKVNIKVLENLNVAIYEYYVNNNIIESLVDINCDINSNSEVEYNNFNNNNQIELSKKVVFNLSENSTLKTYSLEIGNNTKTKYHINLNEERSSVNFNLMVYADNEIYQNHMVSINHLKPYTYSSMNNHGVINDNSTCAFDVKSFVKKGAIKSEAYQSSKIITLSDHCKTELNPQLLIDEHDVMGSHAASCGRISEEIIYYMQSRGIDKMSANKLIAVGNLLNNAPKNLLDALIEEIERRISHE